MGNPLLRLSEVLGSLFKLAIIDVIIDFVWNSASLATSFKGCNVIMTCKDKCREIDNVYQVNLKLILEVHVTDN